MILNVVIWCIFVAVVLAIFDCRPSGVEIPTNQYRYPFYTQQYADVASRIRKGEKENSAKVWEIVREEPTLAHAFFLKRQAEGYHKRLWKPYMAAIEAENYPKAKEMYEAIRNGANRNQFLKDIEKRYWLREYLDYLCHETRQWPKERSFTKGLLYSCINKDSDNAQKIKQTIYRLRSRKTSDTKETWEGISDNATQLQIQLINQQEDVRIVNDMMNQQIAHDFAQAASDASNMFDNSTSSNFGGGFDNFGGGFDNFGGFGNF